MYRKSIALLLVSSCFFVVGCADSHDKVTRDSIAQMKKLVNVLEGIKTVEDAKAAKGQLESIAKNMKALKTRMDKLGDPSPELEKKLKEKYEDDLKELMPKMLGVMMTMKPEIQKELETSMSDVMPKSGPF